MGENALDGTLSSEFGLLTNLGTFFPPCFLHGCTLFVTLTHNLHPWYRTEEFDVYSNQLSGFLPTEFGLLINADYLVVANNGLGGPIPETLGSAASLRGISLSNNTMTGTVPASLGLLENLQFLQLNGNDFVGKVPWEVCNLATSGMSTQILANCQLPEIECDCCQICY
jgi:hypothetical protein